MIRVPPRSTPFPYTTLFRSVELEERLSASADRLRATEAVLDRRTDERDTARADLDRRTDELAETHRELATARERDRKSTRLNSSHANISYAVFCLKKKNIK